MPAGLKTLGRAGRGATTSRDSIGVSASVRVAEPGAAAAIAGQGGARDRQAAEGLMDAPRDTDRHSRSDCARYSRYWDVGRGAAARSCRRSPRAAPARGAQAAEDIKREARETRGRFRARTPAPSTTGSRRTARASSASKQLVYDAASLVPGARADARAGRRRVRARAQRDKDGIEIDQGIFVSACARERGARAPPVPRHAAAARRRRSSGWRSSEANGRIDLGAARGLPQGQGVVRHPEEPAPPERRGRHHARRGRRSRSTSRSSTRRPQICVLRGDAVAHRQARRQARCSAAASTSRTSITARCRFIWYLQRDLGVVNKVYRGLAMPEALPDDVSGKTLEKPWIAAVEGFAIGGHCQYPAGDGLRASRRKDAYHDAARAQGRHHPGRGQPAAAALRRRPHRAPGDHVPSAASTATAPKGRLICDEIVAPGEMDAAIERVGRHAHRLGRGERGVGNRRAFRVAQEPLDLFRRYMSRLRARAGVLPLQPGADRQPRAALERERTAGSVEGGEHERDSLQCLRRSRSPWRRAATAQGLSATAGAHHLALSAGAGHRHHGARSSRRASRGRWASPSWSRTARARAARSGPRRPPRRAPDGYTLAMGTVGRARDRPGALYSKLGYDPVRDFAPISNLGLTPQTLVVSARVRPAQTLRDLVEQRAGRHRSTTPRRATARRAISRWRCSARPRART